MGLNCCSNSNLNDKEKNLSFVGKPHAPHGNQSEGTKEAIDKYFKGANSGCVMEEKIYQELSKLGFTDENTLFSDSSCPDEINHDDINEDITSLF